MNPVAGLTVIVNKPINTTNIHWLNLYIQCWNLMVKRITQLYLIRAQPTINPTIATNFSSLFSFLTTSNRNNLTIHDKNNDYLLFRPYWVQLSSVFSHYIIAWVAGVAFRSVFRTDSNIYDEAFLRKWSWTKKYWLIPYMFLFTKS